jgi:hypothetical protein
MSRRCSLKQLEPQAQALMRKILTPYQESLLKIAPSELAVGTLIKENEFVWILYVEGEFPKDAINLVEVMIHRYTKEESCKIHEENFEAARNRTAVFKQYEILIR